jgi:UDP-N-acetylglucosamine diphosphorylase/glucosamine-1-phosphate N-acetyltransferase
LKVAIILAAGKGIRMKSDLPKVFHSLVGKPMLSYVLDAADDAGFDRTYVVVGYRAGILKDYYKDRDVVFVDQKEQLGTAHAVMQVAPLMRGIEAMTVVLAGDMPLISSKTLKGLMEFHSRSKAAATVLVATFREPFGYGRIVRDGEYRVARIVEEKDASEDEKKIKEINTGIYCFGSRALFDCLDEVRPENAQREFYLTDVIGILNGKGMPVLSFSAAGPDETMGVNSREQLDELEKMIVAKAGQ